MKGHRPKDQQVLADPVPQGKLEETHTWVKGYCKGKVAIFVDDLLQSGHKASNLEFLKALEEQWTMSTPEHVSV
eukprot:9043505-Prorocentrum_lima.AAC.1